MNIRNAQGVTIEEAWADGPRTWLGLMVAGFPNLFHVAGAGSTSAFTAVTLCIEHHADWILQCIGWLDAHGRSSIDATEAALELGAPLGVGHEQLGRTDVVQRVGHGLGQA